MNTEFKKNGNLIGADVDIQLIVSDLDVRHKLGQSVPELPQIQCRLVKRGLTWTWTYAAELKKPLLLDIEGIGEEAGKKMFAHFIKISPSYAYSDDELNRRDNIFLQIMEKGKIEVGVFYLEHPNKMPNELSVGSELDNFSKTTPTIAHGVMTLKK